MSSCTDFAGFHQLVRFAVCSSAIVLASWKPAGADEALKQRFLSEAPKAWKALQKAKVGLQGTLDYTYTDLPTGHVVEKTKNEMKLFGDWALFIVRREAGQRNKSSSHLPTATVYGTNSPYAFKLVQKSGSDAWIIEKLDPHVDTPQPASSDQLSDYARGGARQALAGGLGLYPRHFDRMVGDHVAFKLKTVEAVRRGSDELVKLTFSYQPQEREDIQIPNGTVLLDPGRFWLIREADVEMKWPSDEVGTVSIRFEYDDTIADIPLIKKASLHIQAKPAGPRAKQLGITKPMNQMRVFQYNMRKLENPDEKEFMLSAFGLPEPGLNRAPSNRRTWLWFLLGVGLLLVVLGFVLRRRSLQT